MAAASSDLQGRVLGHRANVVNGEEVSAFVDCARQEFGQLDGFCNNAGVGGVHKSIADTTEEEWDQSIAVNLRGVFLGHKYTMPAMTSGGAIVNTGSILSLKAAADRSDYVATKHAVLGLTRTAAAEGARAGLRVNCICPGPIDTPLMAESERLVNPQDPGWERRRFEEGTPVGRYGRPEEIAELVAFLMSNRAPYLTGAAVSIDGGLMAV